MTRTLGAFALLTALVACNGEATTEEPTGTTTRTEDILSLTGDTTAGADVYAANCAVCHAADGSGGSGPALTAAIPGMSEEEIVDLVLNGEGVMPAFDNLSDQEIADLTAYAVATFP